MGSSLMLRYQIVQEYLEFSRQFRGGEHMPTIRRIAITAISYLLGGISTGYYLVKWRTGEDIRVSGSGSSGARNVGRSLGKAGYIVTAAGDITKGIAIPSAVRKLDGSRDDTAMASIAAVVGHVWPAQLGFRGGRGLTVAFGAVMASEPRVGIASIAIAGALLPITRSFTSAGLIATAAAPVLSMILRVPVTTVKSIGIMASIVLIGHRHYIRKAFRGDIAA